MARQRGYEFDEQFTPEQAYAVPQFRRGNYEGGSRGGSMAAGDGAWQGVQLAAPESGNGLRAGQIMGNMREAAVNVATPNREGFKTSSEASDLFAESGEALSEAQGDAYNQALSGTGQALLDRSRGRAELNSRLSREMMSIQAANEQTADSRKKGGGVLGAIGSIVGGIVGGPVGAGIGALGSLFG